MIFYENHDLLIRDMNIEDVYTIHNERLSHGWHSDISVYEKYLEDQVNNKLFVFIAEYKGEIVGYTTLKPFVNVGPFASRKLPEISDFNVFVKYRYKGIGSSILDVVESFASQSSDTITLAVGLHSGYGAAQRLYIKRGYIPDGSGVWYQDNNLIPYKNCSNDDSLVLYLYKQIR